MSQPAPMMTDYHNLIMSYCTVHRVITIIITVPHLFHRSNHRGVMSVLLCTLDDLRHCPILGRGQEVRAAAFSALHPDWLTCLNYAGFCSLLRHEGMRRIAFKSNVCI